MSDATINGIIALLLFSVAVVVLFLYLSRGKR